MPSILVFVLFFAGVYFLLLRPQQQRVRRQRELITAIGVGDRVVTAGGLIGRVVDVNDDRLLLEVADGVVVELLRLAISRRLDESETMSDSVFGASSTSDDLEEAYAADDYQAESEPAEATSEAGPGSEADEAVDASGAVGPTTVQPAEPPVASDPPMPPDAPVPPTSAGGTAVPGGAGSPLTGGAAGPDSTITEAPAPAPRQDPH